MLRKVGLAAALLLSAALVPDAALALPGSGHGTGRSIYGGGAYRHGAFRGAAYRHGAYRGGVARFGYGYRPGYRPGAVGAAAVGAGLAAGAVGTAVAATTQPWGWGGGPYYGYGGPYQATAADYGYGYPNAYAYPMNAYAMSPPPAAVGPGWMGGIKQSDYDLYMKNLHDSGYNPKDDYTATGSMKAQ